MPDPHLKDPTPAQEAASKAMLAEVRTAIEAVIRKHGGDKPGVAYLDLVGLAEALVGLGGVTARPLPEEVKRKLLPELISMLVENAGAKLQFMPLAVTRSRGGH